MPAKPKLPIDGKLRCPGCMKTMPVEEFGRNRRNPSGRVCRCKACTRAKVNKLRYKSVYAGFRPAERGGRTEEEALAIAQRVEVYAAQVAGGQRITYFPRAGDTYK